MLKFVKNLKDLWLNVRVKLICRSCETPVYTRSTLLHLQTAKPTMADFER